MDDIEFRMLTEHSVDVIARASMDGVVEYVSPSIQKMLGWLPAEIIGHTSETFVFAEDLPIIAAAIARFSSGEAEQATTTIRALRRDGTNCWMETNARLVRDTGTGKPIGVVLVMRDVSERKALEDQLKDMALKDGLTGLFNRRAFDEVMDREWRRTLREGGEMSLLLLDEGLLAAADMALYKAKHAGRNSVATSLVLAPDESPRPA